MFVQPNDLPNQRVAQAAAIGWALEFDSLFYAPVGFGSHHWSGIAGGTRWFLTVDRVDDGGSRLLAALGTATALRADGRDWVVAPQASVDGEVVKPIDDHYVLAVYPWVDGASGSFGAYPDDRQREAVVERLVDLHRSDIKTRTRSDDLTVPARDNLVDAFDNLSSPWSTGPFAERTRSLIHEHRSIITAAFDRYDELAAVVESEPQRYCVTHGEPHPGNVIFTNDGPALIDWDTALLAPPERDLWRFIDEDDGSRSFYERLSGRTLDDQALQLYQLWWDLCEISLYTADFRTAHAETKDTATGWQSLQESCRRLARSAL